MEIKQPKFGIPLWKVLVLGMIMVVLPQIFIYYLRSDSRDTFYRYVDENRSECMERSEKDQFPRQVCIESARQAREAFTATAGEIYPVAAIILSLNFSVAVAVLGLGSKVARLSKRDE